MFLQLVLAAGLDVELIERFLEEGRGDFVTGSQLLGDVEDGFGTQVEQLPVVEIPELLEYVLTRTDAEVFGDEAQRSILLHGPLQ